LVDLNNFKEFKFLAFFHHQHVVVVQVGTHKIEVCQTLAERHLVDVFQVYHEGLALAVDNINHEAGLVEKGADWKVALDSVSVHDIDFSVFAGDFLGFVIVEDTHHLEGLGDEHVHEDHFLVQALLG